MKRKNIKKCPTDVIKPFLDNPFLKDFRGDDIIYTKDFYVAMYKKISEEHMTYVAAYNSLGFSTAVLGENRANSAGKRAVQMAREDRLFTVDPSSYDGSVPREAMGAMSPAEELAYLKARNSYLEELATAQKKTPLRIGGHDYIIEAAKVNADQFQMADAFIRKQAEKPDGLSVTQCLHMFGVSRSGYYSWVNRQKDADGSQAEKRERQNKLKELFRQIVRKLGFVPGKRTFQTYLWREFNVSISVKQCRRIMTSMNLVANRPKKDAYKHQATHDHEYAAPLNTVKQDYYIGPRKIILTDITYLYYGPVRTPVYLCAFKDAYTKEILGHHC